MKSAIQKVAETIGVNSSYLENILENRDKLYKAYYIPKGAIGSADLRRIEAPNVNLKSIQRWILRNILEKVPISDLAHGFVKGRGIKTNARYHLDRQFILAIDIKDFFPSVTQDKVHDVFLRVTGENNIAFVYTGLCTFQGRLPQGGVTSPLLSNIVFYDIDEKIEDVCNRGNIAYSRYADDMTFSSNDFQALKEIYKSVQGIIESAGYNLNEDKTRYYTGKGRMLVTGIRLNSGRMKTGRYRKRTIRALIHHYFVRESDSVNLNKLLGKIAFVRDIEPDYYLKLKEYVAILKTKYPESARWQ